MNLFFEALNRPAEAFRRGEKMISWTIVGVTILVNSILEPVLQHWFGITAPAFNIAKSLKLMVMGVLSYSVICAMFWLLCKSFGSKTTLKEHLSSWGITFFPTALCSVVVAVTEVFFYVFWNSTVWGMLLNFIFIGILIWKAILYVLYIRDFTKLRGWRFVVAFILMGFVILMMATLSGYLGIKTPVI